MTMAHPPSGSRRAIRQVELSEVEGSGGIRAAASWATCSQYPSKSSMGPDAIAEHQPRIASINSTGSVASHPLGSEACLLSPDWECTGMWVLATLGWHGLDYKSFLAITIFTGLCESGKAGQASFPTLHSL